MYSLDCPVTFACSILLSSSDIAKKKKGRGGEERKLVANAQQVSFSNLSLFISFLSTVKRLMKHNFVPSVAFDKSNNVPIITNHPLPLSVQDQRLGIIIKKRGQIKKKNHVRYSQHPVPLELP